jgi:tetratricopeptide (TPR) repeat protein
LQRSEHSARIRLDDGASSQEAETTPSAAEQTVVRHALARGWLSEAALQDARRLQAEAQAAGRPASLLELLRSRWLRPEHLPELERVWAQALGGHAAPTAPGSSATTPTLPPASHAAAPVEPTAPTLSTAARLEDYLEVQGELGRGGMGVVHAVLDRRLGREAALKLMLPHKARSPAAVTRFLREARVTARLAHPGVPPVYEAGIDSQGRPYLLMKRIEGEPLGERILAHDHDRPVDPHELRWLREQVACLVRIGETVAYAHARGVLHRDLKPDNAMCGRYGEVMVLDWGLARVTGEGSAEDEVLLPQAHDALGPGQADGPAALTQAGATLGTPGYMPPEQVKGPAVDERADVFALGAILSAILTGLPPVDGDLTADVLYATLKGRIVGPRQRRPGLPRELDAVARRALEPDPARRTPTAEDFVADLAAWLAGEEVAAYRYRPHERALRWARLHPTLLVATTLLVLCLGAAGFLVRVLDAQSQARLGADAKDAAERSWRTPDALAELPPGERTAQALAALQAAARWHELSGDPRAEAAHHEAACALGDVALQTSQWELAELAFTQAAALGVDPELARARLDDVGRARKAETERRVAEVTDLLVSARRGELRERPEGVADAVYDVVRYPDPEVVALLAQRLGALAEDRQQAPLEGGALDEARLACEALGRLGQRRPTQPGAEPTPLDPAPAVHALADLLAAEDDERLALVPAVALVRIGSPDALAHVHAARRRLGVNGHFARQVERYLGRDPEQPAPPPDEDTALGWFDRGDALRAQGDLRAAVEAYGRAIELDPRDVTAYNNRGMARESLGDLEGAIADYDQALEIDPRYATAYLNRASARVETDSASAIADYDQAIELDPSEPAAFTNRGLAKERLGDLAGALADYDLALELDPHNALAHNSLGSTRQELGDLEGAIHAYDRAIELDARYAQAYNNRGTALAGLGDLNSARADYDRALELDPGYSSAFNNRGAARAALGDFQGAIADYDQAVAHDARYAGAVNNRGSARRALGDLEGAIADYDRALVLDPRLTQAHTNRGLAHTALGDLESAIADHGRALEIDPRNALAHAYRGAVRAALGDPQGAIDDYDRAIELDPRFGWAYTHRGDAHKSLRDFPGALADYDRALELDPNDSGARAGRGVIRGSQGDLEGAIEDLERFLELDPHHAAAGRVRDYVAGLRQQVGGSAE